MSLIAGAFFPDRMSRPLAVLALVLLFAGWIAAPAHADIRDVYTISGVPIDATAASSQAARDQAVANGERRAVRLLLERLALRRDHPRLPQVAPADLQGLIEGFEISNERLSAVRYQADISVTFKAAAIRALMAQATIPIAETQSGLILVLPVWRSGQSLQLFDDTNPWREAWIRIATGKGLVPMTTPLGDAKDLGLITAEQAVSGNQTALAAIARQYNVSEVIVAQASGDAKGETIEQLSITRYAIGGPRSTVAATPRRPPEALLATALGIAQEIEESWKSGTLNNTAMTPPTTGNVPLLPGGDAQTPAGPTLAVNVPVRQLSEWLAIRKTLESVNLIKKIDVSTLGLDGAAIVLSYVGGEQQLQSALAQVDLLLSNDGGNWTLRAKGGGVAPSLPAAVPVTPNTPPGTPPGPPPAMVSPPPGSAPVAPAPFR